MTNYEWPNFFMIAHTISFLVRESKKYLFSALQLSNFDNISDFIFYERDLIRERERKDQFGLCVWN